MSIESNVSGITNIQGYYILKVLDSVDKNLIDVCGEEAYYRMCIKTLKDATTNPSERLYGYLIIGGLIEVTARVLNQETRS
jgi:hypothetical protein